MTSGPWIGPQSGAIFLLQNAPVPVSRLSCNPQTCSAPLCCRLCHDMLRILIVILIWIVRTALRATLPVGAILPTAPCIKLQCLRPDCWRCPRLSGCLGQCSGTVSCHQRFGNSIGGKAHQRTPRGSKIEGFLPAIRTPRPMCPGQFPSSFAVIHAGRMPV